MSKQEYKISANKIKYNTEESTAVSLISYEIENANYKGLNKHEIYGQIDQLKVNKDFPKNLEYVDSHTDPITGTTVAAFENTDTGKVIVGMAGTNVHMEEAKATHDDLINFTNPVSAGLWGFKESLNAISLIKKNPDDYLTYLKSKRQNYIDTLGTIQDIGADINISTHSVSDTDLHFMSTQNFIKDLKKEHDIDTITGHSLGGRDAMILGMSNDIDNIITYNTAPINVKSIRILVPLLTLTEAARDDNIENMINNYDGKITHFISDEDELNGVVNQFTHVLPGKRIIIPNGKNHSMGGFLSKYEQMIITNSLNKPNEFKNEMKKSFKKNNNYTKSKLNEINDIKNAMVMQNGGGALSSSQQKLLEYVTALVIVKGLSQQLTSDIEQLNKMYEEIKDTFKNNWEDALESGETMGSNLSSQEIMDALYEGGVYEDKLVTIPFEKISEKLKKLNATATQYREFITKVEDSIDEIINNDQMLANQIGGLL
ncbi:hypothetical protein [Staphylococcus hyicus]|uniref:hypothetical protein n=1 Tax=Staphylococcus hyicus TaxID=1284 RepID=UPI00057FFF9A|nr:hypothetical protein [Staphylococcus hyicus]AJC94933.1 membrane protein [Staphylococcus hyicus]RTX67977.1 hypothetical protein EKQ60_06515 [Staphylococcus hyicus]SQE46419.1 Insertion sequenceATP-binding protein, putative [Staphylococcus hyicus]